MPRLSVQQSLASGKAVVERSWPAAVAAYAELRRDVARRYAPLAPPPDSARPGASAVAVLRHHAAAMDELRRLGSLLHVPRDLRGFDGSPLSAPGCRCDPEELGHWLEQRHPAAAAADPELVPLPLLLAHAESLARYHGGLPTPDRAVGRIHPFHAAAGIRTASEAVLFGRLGHWLATERSVLAESRAAGATLPRAQAAAEVRTLVHGVASDAGLGLATALRAPLKDVLAVDPETDALLMAEDTARAMVAAGSVRRQGLALRTAPRCEERDFDLAIRTAAVAPPLVSPLLPARDVSARHGAGTAAAWKAFDDAVPALLRPHGGFVAVVYADTWGLPPAAAPEQALPRIADGAAALPPSASAVLRATQSLAAYPEQWQAAALHDAAARRQFLGDATPAEADPFCFASAGRRGLDWTEAMAAAAATAYRPLRGHTAVYRVALQEGRARGAAEDAPPRLLGGETVVCGVGPEATQGGVEYRDTYEYTHYLPKGGPAATRHWTEEIDAFDYLAPSPDRAAAVAARRADDAAGARPAAPLDSVGRRLHPAPRTDVVARMGGSEAEPALAAKAHEMRRQTTISGEAATAPGLLPALFASEERSRRRSKTRRLALRSAGAVEQYIDDKLLPSAEVKLRLLREFDRLDFRPPKE